MLTRSVSRFIALVAIAAMSLSACVTNRTLGDGIDDTTADLSMKSRLLQDKLYDYSDVDMTVFEGRVMLTGSMRTEEGRRHVANLVRDANGVNEVLNEIVLGERTSFQQGTNDFFIDERLGAALLTDDTVIRSNYQIAVSNGVVYLLGVAQGPNELNRAVDHARNMKGVIKVVSHVLYVDDPRRQVRKPASVQPAAVPVEDPDETAAPAPVEQR